MLERLPEPHRLVDPELKRYLMELIRAIRLNEERLDATDVNNTAIFDEAAQDAVALALTDTATIDFTYNDPLNQITADLTDTTVVPGSYTNTDLTVDAQGRITSAANGTVATDYLSSVYYVQLLETITIPIYRQMLNKESLTIDGTLVVNGQLFLEA